MKRVIVYNSEHFIPHSWFVKTNDDSPDSPWRVIRLYQRGVVNIKEVIDKLGEYALSQDWSEIKPEPFSPSPTCGLFHNPQSPKFSNLSVYMWIRENFDFVEHKILAVRFASRELFEEFVKIFPMSSMTELEKSSGEVCDDGSYSTHLFMTFKERFALSRLKEDHGWELVLADSGLKVFTGD